MPVYRGPDGRIIEEKTELHDPDRARTAPTDRPRGGAGGSDLDAETVKMGATPQGGAGGDDPRTQLMGRGRSRADQPAGAGADPMADPVVGWLAVIKGPGQGAFAPLGLGTNSIGRSPEDRVTLDYGDEMISRSGHAIVTYDPRGRKFYVQHGGGTNLTYLGDAPVLQAMPLPANADILIGETTLRFVPLCGEDFSWTDVSGADD